MNRKSKHIRYCCLVFAALLIVWLLLPGMAKAADSPQAFSLTAISRQGNVSIPNANFRLYRVATLSAGGTYETHPHFSGSGVSLASEDDTASSWSASAATLESYVIQRAAENAPITPVATGSTDETGTVKFSDLAAGLYLLVGDQTTIGQNVYTPSAALLSLPYYENGTKSSDPSIYIKNSLQQIPTPMDLPPTYIDLTVVKIWHDTGYEAQRPSEVTVTLYRNGEEYGSVTLSTENNWRYTWSVLEDTARWNIAERDVPAHYTVTSVQNGNVFTVTNTYAPNVPDIPTITDEPGAKLPQTGQLWWPVSLMALCGLILLILGYGIRRRGKDRDE